MSLFLSFKETEDMRTRVTVTGLILAAVAMIALVLLPIRGAEAQSFSTLRVKATSGNYTDSQSNVWSGATGFSGGNENTSNKSISGTDDDTLYNNERWGAFSWSASVPNGVYQVTLLFAETTTGGSGNRVFDVTAEGNVALDNLDIYAEAGGDAALQKVFNVTVNDGSLNLGFVVGSADNPKVNGIQVTQVSQATNTPTVTPTPTNTPVPTATATPAPRPSLSSVSNLADPLTGNVTLVANISGTATRVEFERTGPSNGEGYVTDTSTPYEFAWDTSATPSGRYRLAVYVFDAQGLADEQEFFLSAGSSAPPTATAVPVVPTVTPGPTPAAKTLLDTYELLQPDEGVPGTEPADYAQTVYRPRQWTGSNYSGWDWMSVPGVGFDTIRGGDFVKLNLNRAARIGIVWRGGSGNVPNWITSNYTSGSSTTEDSNTYPVYLRDVSAGSVVLGAMKDTEGGSPVTSYRILLAEQNGVAPSAPSVPGGLTVPQPNQTCPAWVHDQYVTVRDGVTYATWHRQIDPVYYCYFRHDHGSDPSLFGDGSWTPAYGAAGAGSSAAENHQGFKSALFEHPDDDGRQYYLTMHFGVVNAQGAACNRFHDYGLAVWRRTDGVLESDVMIAADFGKSVENASNAPLNAGTCPGGNPNLAVGSGNTGERRMPIYNGANGNGDPIMYEPWRPFLSGTVVGFNSVASMNTPDVYTVCTDLNCTSTQITGGLGLTRFLNVVGGFGIKGSLASATGTFYTNARATQVVQQTAGAVRQYVRSDADASWTYMGDNHACGIHGNRFHSLYACTTDPDRGSPAGLEDAITMPN